MAEREASKLVRRAWSGCARPAGWAEVLDGRERVDSAGGGSRPDRDASLGLARAVRKAARMAERVMVTGNSRRMFVGVVWFSARLCDKNQAQDVNADQTHLLVSKRPAR
jgi:hypothetical protein